jgi:hypothetical protein
MPFEVKTLRVSPVPLNNYKHIMGGTAVFRNETARAKKRAIPKSANCKKWDADYPDLPD